MNASDKSAKTKGRRKRAQRINYDKKKNCLNTERERKKKKNITNSPLRMPGSVQRLVVTRINGTRQ